MQAWLTLDILCCTASILNLTAIALDRYWAIRYAIEYANRRTLKLVTGMIGVVWLVAGSSAHQLQDTERAHLYPAVDRLERLVVGHIAQLVRTQFRARIRRVLGQRLVLHSAHGHVDCVF
jgi:hypothetical protein